MMAATLTDAVDDNVVVVVVVVAAAAAADDDEGDALTCPFVPRENKCQSHSASLRTCRLGEGEVVWG